MAKKAYANDPEKFKEKFKDASKKANAKSSKRIILMIQESSKKRQKRLTLKVQKGLR